MVGRNKIGMTLIKIEEGDPDNLKGQVMIYATVHGIPIVHEQSDVHGDSTKDIEALLQSVELCLQPQDEQDTLNQKLFPFYEEGSEQDLETESVDVVTAGEFNDSRKAELAMIGIYLTYANIYLDQQKGEKSYESGSYKDLERKGILETTLSLSYIDPIVQGIKHGNMEARNNALGELIKFCEASPLENTSLDLANLLLSDKPDENLHGLYFKLIHAVASGGDERATYIEGMINDALSTTPIYSRLPVETRKMHLREKGLRI